MYGLLTKSRELGLSASIRNYGDAFIAPLNSPKGVLFNGVNFTRMGPQKPHNCRFPRLCKGLQLSRSNLSQVRSVGGKVDRKQSLAKP